MKDDDKKYYGDLIEHLKKKRPSYIGNRIDSLTNRPTSDPVEIALRKYPELKDLPMFSSIFTPTIDPSDENVYRAIFEQAYRDGQIDKDFLDRLTGPMNPFRVNSSPEKKRKF